MRHLCALPLPKTVMKSEVGAGVGGYAYGSSHTLTTTRARYARQSARNIHHALW